MATRFVSIAWSYVDEIRNPYSGGNHYVCANVLMNFANMLQYAVPGGIGFGATPTLFDRPRDFHFMLMMWKTWRPAPPIHLVIGSKWVFGKPIQGYVPPAEYTRKLNAVKQNTRLTLG